MSVCLSVTGFLLNHLPSHSLPLLLSWLSWWGMGSRDTSSKPAGHTKHMLYQQLSVNAHARARVHPHARTHTTL
jgi:hypothetical protein